MIYENISMARFLRRENRFIAKVEINGSIYLCHVKNTGRCKELLIEGAIVFVQENDNLLRKTKYSLICVKKGDRLINIDSQIPNYVVIEALKNKKIDELRDIYYLKQEIKYKNSRFDVYFEKENGKKGFIEIKGVTLEEDGIVKFPDAPSERAIKHINELIEAKQEGYDAYIFFIIQMKGVKYFEPNKKTHFDFYEALKSAKSIGLNILAYDCNVFPDEINLNSYVEIKI